MKFIKSFGFGLSIFLILNLIVTIFSYFDLFSENIINIIKIIVLIISFLISGLYLGINSKNKVLLNGTKLSLLYILLSVILIIIIPNLDFSYKTILYYIFLILLVNIGTFIGINKKKTNLK